MTATKWASLVLLLVVGRRRAATGNLSIQEVKAGPGGRGVTWPGIRGARISAACDTGHECCQRHRGRRTVSRTLGGEEKKKPGRAMRGAPDGGREGARSRARGGVGGMRVGVELPRFRHKGADRGPPIAQQPVQGLSHSLSLSRSRAHPTIIIHHTRRTMAYCCAPSPLPPWTVCRHNKWRRLEAAASLLHVDMYVVRT